MSLTLSSQTHIQGQSALELKLLILSSLIIYTNMHLCPRAPTPPRLFICSDISRKSLTLLSSIFQGLTTTCHIPSPLAVLLHHILPRQR